MSEIKGETYLLYRNKKLSVFTPVYLTVWEIAAEKYTGNNIASAYRYHRYFCSLVLKPFALHRYYG